MWGWWALLSWKNNSDSFPFPCKKNKKQTNKTKSLERIQGRGEGVELTMEVEGGMEFLRNKVDFSCLRKWTVGIPPAGGCQRVEPSWKGNLIGEFTILQGNTGTWVKVDIKVRWQGLSLPRSPLYHLKLEQVLAHSRYITTICWITEYTKD